MTNELESAEKEIAIRVAFTELRGDDSQRNNAYDGLAEAGIKRGDRVVICSILEASSSEDGAIAQIRERLPHLFH